MRDQREHESPVTLTRDGDAVVAERRGTQYVTIWQEERWKEEGEWAGAWTEGTEGSGVPKGGPRWYIRLDEEDVPIPQHNAYAGLGEAKVHEAQAMVTPKRGRVGRKR